MLMTDFRKDVHVMSGNTGSGTEVGFQPRLCRKDCIVEICFSSLKEK